MAFGKVKIVKPIGRLIYINGNYDEAAGKSPDTFTVELGPNLFETLNGNDEVDYSGQVTLTAANPNAELSLDKQ